MRVRNSGPLIKVTVEREPEPAWYLSRFMPVAATPAVDSENFYWLGVQSAAHPDPSREFVLRALSLPQSFHPRMPEFLPGALDRPGIGVPWLTDGSSGLYVPEEAHWERVLTETWSASVVASPELVGIDIDSSIATSLGWAALTKFDPLTVIRVAGALAFRLEVIGVSSSPADDLVSLLDLPGETGVRLRAAVRGRHPLFDPRCLRWIVREAAGAVAAGEWYATVESSDDDLGQAVIERVFLSSTLGGGRPTQREMLRAFWLLHAGFYGDADDFDTAEHLVSSITSMGFARRDLLTWLARLERWRQIYNVPDDHPAVVKSGNGLKPSQIRDHMRVETSLSIDDWFFGASAIVFRIFTWVAQGNPHISSLEILRTEAATSPIDQRVTNAIRSHVVTTPDELGRAVIAETEREFGSYSGLGSTPRYEALATRAKPVVVLPGDPDLVLLPLGIDVLAERIAELPRALADEAPQLGGRRQVGGLLGYMFEARVTDILLELNDRHTVLTESELARVSGGKRLRGDAMVSSRIRRPRCRGLTTDLEPCDCKG